MASEAAALTFRGVGCLAWNAARVASQPAILSGIPFSARGPTPHAAAIEAQHSGEIALRPPHELKADAEFGRGHAIGAPSARIDLSGRSVQSTLNKGLAITRQTPCSEAPFVPNMLMTPSKGLMLKIEKFAMPGTLWVSIRLVSVIPETGRVRRLKKRSRRRSRMHSALRGGCSHH